MESHLTSLLIQPGELLVFSEGISVLKNPSPCCIFDFESENYPSVGATGTDLKTKPDVKHHWQRCAGLPSSLTPPWCELHEVQGQGAGAHFPSQSPQLPLDLPGQYSCCLYPH